MNARRERLTVLGCEAIGAYTLLRIGRGGLEAGTPGQFFMLEVPGRVLPRPMSLCQAPPGELGFLMEPIGPGTRTLCALEPGATIHVLGPLGNGFDLSVRTPLLVAGGIGIAPMPYLSEALPDDPGDVLACGPEPMLEAVRVLVPNAQLAGEAPMACGYGACYGCAVERDGHYVRLCIEGPVLRDAA